MVDIFMENCCWEHMFGANMEQRFENVSYAAPAVVQTKNPRVPIGHLSTGAVCNWCNFSLAGGSTETDGCCSRDPRFGWGCHCCATNHGAAEELGLGGLMDLAPAVTAETVSQQVRAAAAEALGRLRDESAVPALLLGLKAGNLWQNQGTQDHSKFRMLWKHHS